MQNWVDKRALCGQLLAHCNETRKEMYDGILPDVMMPVSQWPEKEIRKFLGSHVGFNDRCSLFYFLAGNGMPMNTLVDWSIAQPGWLKHDKSALHMASLIEAHMKGDFDGSTGKEPKMIWHVERKELVPCITPNFALEEDNRRMKVMDFDDEGVPIEGTVRWEHVKPGDTVPETMLESTLGLGVFACKALRRGRLLLNRGFHCLSVNTAGVGRKPVSYGLLADLAALTSTISVNAGVPLIVDPRWWTAGELGIAGDGRMRPAPLPHKCH